MSDLLKRLETEVYQNLRLEDVVGDRFGRYSKYIIQDRALPDARDGLKPVQRRILYAMFNDGNTHEKPFRKSAKTVGNVIGNYHPHGDSSVYDAMVRMSQDWKLRNELIEMHGNNGSLDGDPPAAMRYTEARLSTISSELLRDIDKKTVEFAPNFDDTDMEPTVLPASYPNLLVNGSTGISAGYATEIPPHCLSEVIDATVLRVMKPDCTLDDVMQVMKGPDFPTGGIIQGIDGIRKGYETGKGKIAIRAKTAIEQLKGGRQQIAITELPYEVNKANLVRKMDDIRVDKKVDGMSEVRDESDRTGLRVVVELKKEADATLILNYLFKNTDLQVFYHFNMVAIHNRRPEQMSLLAVLDAYIAHRKDVVVRRSTFELEKAKARAHIVEGLMKALSILDEVIAAIRASKDKKDARDNLMKQFQFTEVQAEAIVTLQLYRLTNTDMTALRTEADQLSAQIARLLEILGDQKILMAVITEELQVVRKAFQTPRRSVIEAEIEEIKISQEQLIESVDEIVTVTKAGYVKRTSLRSFAASGGETSALGLKEGDRILSTLEMNTVHTLLAFTNKGNYLVCPVYQLPEIRWKDVGQHINHIVPIDTDEEIVATVSVVDFEQSPAYLTFVTEKGLVKRTALSQLKAQRISKPLVAASLKGNDKVKAVYVTNGTQKLVMVSKKGYVLMFDENDVPVVGTKAAGVIGLKLKDDDNVVASFAVDDVVEESMVLITQRSSAKRLKLSAFEVATRAKRGVVALREVKTNPHEVIAVYPVVGEQKLQVLSKKGHVEEIIPTALKCSDRYSNVTPTFDEKEYGTVVDVWVVDDKTKT